MSFESEFRSHMAADAALTSLVDDRIRPMVQARNDGKPYVTYHIASGQPQNSIDGFTSNLTRYDLQVDCWATSHPTMLSVGEAVRNRLKTNAANIKFVINEYPSFDAFEEETELYRRSIAVSCWHRE